jgi:YggT family protein
MGIVRLIIEIYLFILLARIILSWIPISTTSPFHTVVRVLSALTDPVIRPIRKVLPPIPIGGVGIDLAPLIVLIVAEVLIRVL